MKLLRLEHLDIVCAEIKKSVEFYRKLGLSLEGTLDNGNVVFLFSGDDESPVRVELHQAEEGQKTGIDHIAFEVADTDAAYQEGKYLGLEFKFEPLQNMQSGRRRPGPVRPQDAGGRVRELGLTLSSTTLDLSHPSARVFSGGFGDYLWPDRRPGEGLGWIQNRVR